MATSQTSRALLVIADVGGYTRFMRLHRISIAHAQENVARLLSQVQRMVDHASLAISHAINPPQLQH